MRMKENTAYWTSLILAWCIHNFEEMFTMHGWLVSHYAQLPFAPFFSLEQLLGSFPYALSIATSLLIGIGILAVIQRWDSRFLAVASGMFILNSLYHIFVSIAWQGYSPGVITAGLFGLPLSGYILGKLLRKKRLRGFTLLHVFGYGASALGVSLVLIWLLSLILAPGS